MKKVWLLPLLLSLSACNWVGNVTGLTKEAHKAIGASCRQTGRSLEECFLRNPEADKAAIYAGWREMNEYMSKSKLDTMAPPKEAEASVPSAAAAAAASAPAQAKSAMHGAAAAPGKAAEAGPKPLTNEEAEAQAKNDPQVEAVLAAIKHGDSKPKKAPSSSGEADQNRLLNIINNLNNKKPGEHG